MSVRFIWSAGRRPVRARRPRSPKRNALFGLGSDVSKCCIDKGERVVRMRTHEPLCIGPPIMNSTDLPSPEIPGPPHAGRPRFNWWMFVAVLLAPTLLTALCVLLFDKKGDTAPVIAVFGGGLAGIISGIMLGR